MGAENLNASVLPTNPAYFQTACMEGDFLSTSDGRGKEFRKFAKDTVVTIDGHGNRSGCFDRIPKTHDMAIKTHSYIGV